MTRRIVNPLALIEFDVPAAMKSLRNAAEACFHMLTGTISTNDLRELVARFALVVLEPRIVSMPCRMPASISALVGVVPDAAATWIAFGT
jgi:hypothetical protein